jgi:hypothetical protein
MKRNYGIEWEFFVEKEGVPIPAYTATNNLDGNPYLGEIRTGVHADLLDCLFELQKLIYKERTSLEKKGFTMSALTEVVIGKDVIKELRADSRAVNLKDHTVLKEYSVYNKGTGKILRRGHYKAAFQLNISENEKFSKSVENAKGRYETVSFDSSSIFDYPSVIRELDVVYLENIKSTGRVPGVYAIKSGELGKRIEYRSLPNNIDPMLLYTKVKGL